MVRAASVPEYIPGRMDAMAIAIQMHGPWRLVCSHPEMDVKTSEQVRCSVGSRLGHLGFEEMPEILDYSLGQRARERTVILRSGRLEGQLGKGDEEGAEDVLSHPGSGAYSRWSR